MNDLVSENKCSRMKTLVIKVNNLPVTMQEKEATGLEVKVAAIAQGVTIQRDFVLSMLVGHSGKTKIIGDDDMVHLSQNSRFTAIAHDDNSDTFHNIAPNVLAAISEIKANFASVGVTYKCDDGGGAYVTIESVALGEVFVQKSTWVGFHITFQYPFADVYPHFVRPDLTRKDGQGLGQGISQSNFDGKLATQLSRRSNRRDPQHETALLKVLKVLEWLNNRS